MHELGGVHEFQELGGGGRTRSGLASAPSPPFLLSSLGHCRDLKLENLLLDKRENLKISDFGFSKIVAPQTQPPPTPSYRMMSCFSHLSQTYCGSFAYACPEILLGLPYNPFLSDTWSMGVILYTLVVAHLPFDDSNLKKLLRETQKEVAFPSHLQISDDVKVRRPRVALLSSTTRLYYFVGSLLSQFPNYGNRQNFNPCRLLSSHSYI